MHNVALDLLEMGHKVTGSDDEIYEPSLSRLAAKDLLPHKMGWDPVRIDAGIDLIILGKHAREDNPELIRAQELGLKILSFPEYIGEQSPATKRVVVTGSHGKTTTTSMIMHVLQAAGVQFDYLVGAQLEGFHKMVSLSGADILIVEGDEYPSSALDDKAKMLHYRGNLTVITGLAWDHVNIYKTYDAYKQVFRDLLSQAQAGDRFFFDQTDPVLLDLALQTQSSGIQTGYTALETDKKGQVVFAETSYPIEVFGLHNLKNMHAAMLICNELGISSPAFLTHMSKFTGAAKRLEKMLDSDELIVYRDFAHAPSKARASVAAIKSRYPDRQFYAVLELHTFSSLNIEFIQAYRDCLAPADRAIVYFDPATLASKQLPPLDISEVASAFGGSNLTVVTEPTAIENFMKSCKADTGAILLIMSSGNLGGLDPLKVLAGLN